MKAHAIRFDQNVHSATEKRGETIAIEEKTPRNDEAHAEADSTTMTKKKTFAETWVFDTKKKSTNTRDPNCATHGRHFEQSKRAEETPRSPRNETLRESATSVAIDPLTASRRISELRRALHQSELMRQQCISRTDAFKAECSNLRKILSDQEDRTAELEDRLRLSPRSRAPGKRVRDEGEKDSDDATEAIEVVRGNLLQVSRSRERKLSREIRVATADRDQWRANFLRLRDNGANEAHIALRSSVAELQRLQSENARLQVLIASKDRELSATTSKANQSAKVADAGASELREKLARTEEALRDVRARMLQLTTSHDALNEERDNLKRVYAASDEKLSTLSSQLHGTEKDLQIANAVIESLHARLVSAETSGPQGDLVARYDTEIAAIREAALRERQKMCESVELSRVDLQATESNHAVAVARYAEEMGELRREFRSSESHCSRLRTRLGLLVAGGAVEVSDVRAREDQRAAELNARHEERCVAIRDTHLDEIRELKLAIASARQDAALAAKVEEDDKEGKANARLRIVASSHAKRMRDVTTESRENERRLRDEVRVLRVRSLAASREAKRNAGDWAVLKLEQGQAMERWSSECEALVAEKEVAERLLGNELADVRSERDRASQELRKAEHNLQLQRRSTLQLYMTALNKDDDGGGDDGMSTQELSAKMEIEIASLRAAVVDEEQSARRCVSEARMLEGVHREVVDEMETNQLALSRSLELAKTSRETAEARLGEMTEALERRAGEMRKSYEAELDAQKNELENLVENGKALAVSEALAKAGNRLKVECGASMRAWESNECAEMETLMSIVDDKINDVARVEAMHAESEKRYASRAEALESDLRVARDEVDSLESLASREATTMEEASRLVEDLRRAEADHEVASRRWELERNETGREMEKLKRSAVHQEISKRRAVEAIDELRLRVRDIARASEKESTSKIERANEDMERHVEELRRTHASEVSSLRDEMKSAMCVAENGRRVESVDSKTSTSDLIGVSAADIDSLPGKDERPPPRKDTVAMSSAKRVVETRLPTELTPSPFSDRAMARAESAKPSPLAWATGEMEKGLLSPEDKDSVVVMGMPSFEDEFDDSSMRPTPSYRTPPRASGRGRRLRYDDDDEEEEEEVMDASLPLRKSSSFMCESPESEAALFRKLQEISGVGPASPPPHQQQIVKKETKRVVLTEAVCLPEQLSPGETVALVRQVLRVSLPLLPTKGVEEKIRDSIESDVVRKSVGARTKGLSFLAQHESPVSHRYRLT
eukprot:g505.t1